jgi:hypothetical protein
VIPINVESGFIIKTGANTNDVNSILNTDRDGSKSRRSRADRIAERSRSSSLE